MRVLTATDEVLRVLKGERVNDDILWCVMGVCSPSGLQLTDEELKSGLYDDAIRDEVIYAISLEQMVRSLLLAAERYESCT